MWFCHWIRASLLPFWISLAVTLIRIVWPSRIQLDVIFTLVHLKKSLSECRIAVNRHIYWLLYWDFWTYLGPDIHQHSITQQKMRCGLHQKLIMVEIEKAIYFSHCIIGNTILRIAEDCIYFIKECMPVDANITRCCLISFQTRQCFQCRPADVNELAKGNFKPRTCVVGFRWEVLYQILACNQ